LEQHGVQLVAVVNQQHAEEAARFTTPPEDHMNVMHLDGFWTPLRKNLVMAYSREIDRRTVVRLAMNAGQLVKKDLGGFRNFLTDKGIEIMELPPRNNEILQPISSIWAMTR
jgi:hypothetical protein